MVAGEVQEELEIPASPLSHPAEKRKQVGLVNLRRRSGQVIVQQKRLAASPSCGNPTALAQSPLGDTVKARKTPPE
jgi:hypothetical protein